ncbi:hypothetical protein [Leeuwenhoekiella sp. LLG6367-2.1]|uniref:hypothetical protein n=1 Tax=Leeuwenhoekiella sp. LLG6367-2.1 TaxID=3160833 RepID=UPI003866655E
MNYKNLALTVYLAAISISCSNEAIDIIDESEQEIPDTTDSFKLVSKITTVGDDLTEHYSVFAYDDSHRMVSYADFGQKYVFEYGDNEKVAKAELYTGVVSSPDNYQRDGEMYFKYLDGKLTYSINGDRTETFKYNLQNQVSEIESKSLTSEYYYTAKYTYENDNISNMQFYNVYSASESETSNLTFILDDKINPYNAIWLNYGFTIDIEFEPYGIYDFFLKHNPIEIYEDGKLKMKAIYEYDSDNYPVSCRVTKYSNTGERSYSVEFTY